MISTPRHTTVPQPDISFAARAQRLLVERCVHKCTNCLEEILWPLAFKQVVKDTCNDIKEDSEPT